MPLGSNYITEFLYKIRWILGIICVLSLVLAMDYLFLHILLPMKRQNMTPTLDLPPSISAEAAEVAPVKKTPYLNNVKNCLVGMDLDNEASRSPKKLLEMLLKHPGMQENKKTEEAFTLKDGDTKYELTTRFSESGSSETSLVQIATSGERTAVEFAEPVEKFMDGKTVLNTVVRMKAQFTNGWSLTYQMKGDELASLQLKTDSKILSCVGLACVCR